MGLLDSVIGAVLHNGQTAANPAAAEGGVGNILAMLANNPQMMRVLLGLLGNDGAHGGLGGLVSKFQRAGLGDVIGSWIGSGHNQPISGDQVTQALGHDTLSDLGASLGLDSGAMASKLSQVLPGLVDQLTPQGQAPEGGIGNSEDLFGMLGGLMQPR